MGSGGDFYPFRARKTAARDPQTAVEGLARDVVKVWGPGKGRRAGFHRRKRSPRRGRADGLGSAAVPLLG